MAFVEEALKFIEEQGGYIDVNFFHPYPELQKKIQEWQNDPKMKHLFIKPDDKPADTETK